MTQKDIQQILEAAVSGSLGTLTDDATPFVSLVTVAVTGPRSVAMLLSGLAVHTKNLMRNQAASLLLVSLGGESGDPLAGARVTLTGTVRKLSREEDGEVRGVFLAKHPEAAMYADFGDFSFFVLDIDQAHLVAGFGKIVTVSGVELN
ncbi:HugZ family pyridoxamine 5'-phosphate oxidase [Rubripirellula reticaptiva]|uniref:Pyridoxamine 5'-phosphate oxidase n=1 Tax=Rubripirellula reticaptiva TaxID=2528013 RepID=A0A5C6F993_9BACT|nr:pyridoxamine 5'-phosphate oxidase family protein [Rubripirellula reticaptiva]TWU58313.1 Pyridoxamine 5'-phosphate oxidase [Rubripirellula reticaptiva]